MDFGKIWGEGCQDWIDERRAEGWKTYYANFMFRALRGNPEAVLEQMERSIHREFYVPFMMRFVRHPHREAEQERMPKMMLFPDLPVFKSQRESPRQISINAGGVHYNGVMLIPPVSRFVGCPAVHIDQYQYRYVRGSIARIHVKSIDYRSGRLSDYSVKTVARASKFKCSVADEAHIFILPKPVSEMRHGNSALEPAQKAIKDIQASLNISDELAESLTSGL